MRLPSRLSATAPNREERHRLLDAVSKNGFVDNSRGVRTTKNGREFWMEDGLVWQLIDEHGAYCGQAAAFSKWTFANHTPIKPPNVAVPCLQLLAKA